MKIPVAQFVPVSPQAESLFGYMKNTLAIKGDVVSPVGESWSALDGAEDHFVVPASEKPNRNRARLKK